MQKSNTKLWIVLAVILLLLGAFAVRLATFERYLPYTDYDDENIYYVLGRNWRGVEDSPYIYDKFPLPPLYTTVNTTIQILVDYLEPAEWSVPPQHFYAFRLTAVFAGVLTTACLIAAGWGLAGPLAGWLAGFIWAFAPIIVEHNSLALPDPFVYLTAAAALAFAIRGLRTHSLKWLMASYLAGILCLFTKGWPAHVMLPWGLILLTWAYQNPRKYLPLLIVGSLIFLGVYYGLFEHTSENPNREATEIRTQAIGNMLRLNYHIGNWRFAIYPIGLAAFFGVSLGGLAAFFYSRRKKWRSIDWQWIVILLVYCLAGVALASVFTKARLDAGKIRHVLPMSIALILLWSAFVVQINWTIIRWVQERRPTLQRPVLARLFLPVLIIVGLGLPMITGNAAVIRKYEPEHIVSQVWHWADTNVPLDGWVMMHPKSELELTWNREWGGYDGVKSFQWWHERDIETYDPTEYMERGIVYFAMVESDLENFYLTQEQRDFIDSLYLIKTISATPVQDTVTDSQWPAGTDAYFYRIMPPDVTTNVTFGEQITLDGYDLNETAFTPGETIIVRPYWRAPVQPQGNYSMFIHLYPAADFALLAQYDGTPAAPGRLTQTWTDPAEVYIGPDAALQIPLDLAAGEYRLALGLYDFQTGQRLPTDAGQDIYEIPITIATSN